MADNSEGLGARVGANLRRSVASQGKAWAHYGDLLQQFADKELKATDFGRRAVDVYVGAVGDIVSVGAEIVTDAVKSGMNRFSATREKAEAAISDAEAAVTTSDAHEPAASVRRSAKPAAPTA